MAILILYMGMGDFSDYLINNYNNNIQFSVRMHEIVISDKPEFELISLVKVSENHYILNLISLYDIFNKTFLYNLNKFGVG